MSTSPRIWRFSRINLTLHNRWQRILKRTSTYNVESSLQGKGSGAAFRSPYHVSRSIG